MDQEMDGFATGLSNTICRDGQSTITQDIPWNNRKITGLANATADADALNRTTADGRFARRQAVSAKSTNYTALAADIGTPFRFTAAATLSLTEAATLGNRWHCIVIADGGDVTIDPDGSETINGAATLVIRDGLQTTVACDGVQFFALDVQGVVDAAVTPSAACRLALDGANLRLSRFGGFSLTINGTANEIPNGGVALAATGLTPSTLYYIYAFMNSGTMTLEASTTVPATHTDGTRIKTGDATRALVGMARPVTGPAWVDSVTRRFVRSWFNRRALNMENAFTVQRATTSTTFVELNAEIRCEFLIWEDEVLNASISSYATCASNFTLATIAVDTTVNRSPASAPAIFGSDGACIAATGSFVLSTGYHFATYVARVSGGTGSHGSSTLGFGSLNCIITPPGA
jgi:hypothetical protein